MTTPVLPVDSEAEAHLLGSTWSGLTLNDTEARQLLWEVPPEAFFVTEHRKIWTGMRSLVTDGKEPSEMQLAWVVFRGNPTAEQQAMIFSLLQSGADYTPSPLKDRVLEFAARRVAFQAGREVIAASVDYSLPGEEVTTRANAAFLRVSKGVSAQTSRFWSSDSIADTIQAGLGFQRGEGAAKCCWFGIDWLDDLLICTPGNVTVLGGQPGAGKTGLALQARNLTALAGLDAGFFSLEMEKPELDARDAAWWLSDPAHGRIYAYKDLLRGVYQADRAMAALREQLPGMARAHSWHHSSGIPAGKLIAYITELVHSRGIKLAVVDYFQYIGVVREKGDTLASAYGANSIALKRCAQELGIHILLLSQLNNREGGRPKLGDLKETSQLEQDASAVPMVYRNKNGDPCITLPKDRDGAMVTERAIDVAWPCLRFRQLVRETDPPPQLEF